MGSQTLNVILEAQMIISIREIKELKNGEEIFKVIRSNFEYKNPKFIENEKWGYSNYGVAKKLLSYMSDEEGNLRITRGGMEKLEEILKELDITVNFIDRMLVLPTIYHKDSNLKLRDKDQIPFVEAMLQHFQGSGIGYTSIGKSLMGLEMWRRIGQPGLVIVHTTFLQEQWISEATNPETFNLPKNRIGGIGGVFKGKRVFGDINICLYHSLAKDQHLNFFKERIGFLIFDEGQKAPIEDVNTTVNNFRAKFRYTVSANLERKDGKHFLTFDTFGPVRHVAVEENSDSKILSQVTLVPTGIYDPKYDDNRNYSGFITRMGRLEERNIIICRRVIKKIREGKFVLVFVERAEQAAILHLMLRKFRGDMLLGPTNIYEKNKQTGKTVIKESYKDTPNSVLKMLKDYDDSTAYERIVKAAKHKELDYVVATQKAEVGLSVRTFDHGVITTPTGNNLERFNQQKGRLERTYDAYMEKFFGHKKMVPTLDVLVDENDVSVKAANKIKDKYKGAVKWLKKETTNKVILKKRSI